MSRGRPVICVFAKPPEEGLVKTRLARTVGKSAAAKLAAAFLRDTLDAVGALGWAHVVVATTGQFPAELQPLLGHTPCWDQGEGDLGARVERILRLALEKGDAAFAMGADSPGFPLEAIEEARCAVGQGQAFLAPTEDGGFWLLGLDRCPAGLLEALPWSTEETFASTRERLVAKGFDVAGCDPFFDVDEPGDLVRLAAGLRDGSLHAPTTAGLLEEIGASDPRPAVAERER